jgi:hypothetical protein
MEMYASVYTDAAKLGRTAIHQPTVNQRIASGMYSSLKIPRSADRHFPIRSERDSNALAAIPPNFAFNAGQ